MANTKSALKALRVAERKRRQNQPVNSAAKTYINKARQAVKSGDGDAAQLAVLQATSALDKAARKGVIHPNNAARRKSHLMRQYNASMAEIPDSA